VTEPDVTDVVAVNRKIEHNIYVAVVVTRERGRGPADEAEYLAQHWFAGADPSIGVGSRHHTVPAFYLKRFADQSRQLSVRDRGTGAQTSRSYLKMTITDFYTVVGEDGALDGRLEQLLCEVEGNAARVFGDLLSAFRRPMPLEPARRTRGAASTASWR